MIVRQSSWFKPRILRGVCTSPRNISEILLTQKIDLGRLSGSGLQDFGVFIVPPRRHLFKNWLRPLARGMQAREWKKTRRWRVM